MKVKTCKITRLPLSRTKALQMLKTIPEFLPFFMKNDELGILIDDTWLELPVEEGETTEEEKTVWANAVDKNDKPGNN